MMDLYSLKLAVLNGLFFFHRVALLSARIFYHNHKKLKLQRHKISAKICTESFALSQLQLSGKLNLGCEQCSLRVGKVGQTRKALTYFPFSLQLMLGMGRKKSSCAHKNNENFIGEFPTFSTNFSVEVFLRGHTQREVGRLCVINFNRTIYSLAEREKKAKTFSVVLKAETERTFVITQQLRSLVKNDFSAATNRRSSSVPGGSFIADQWPIRMWRGSSRRCFERGSLLGQQTWRRTPDSVRNERALCLIFSRCWSEWKNMRQGKSFLPFFAWVLFTDIEISFSFWCPT